MSRRRDNWSDGDQVTPTFILLRSGLSSPAWAGRRKPRGRKISSYTSIVPPVSDPACGGGLRLVESTPRREGGEGFDLSSAERWRGRRHLSSESHVSGGAQRGRRPRCPPVKRSDRGEDRS